MFGPESPPLRVGGGAPCFPLCCSSPGHPHSLSQADTTLDAPPGSAGSKQGRAAVLFIYCEFTGPSCVVSANPMRTLVKSRRVPQVCFLPPTKNPDEACGPKPAHASQGIEPQRTRKKWRGGIALRSPASDSRIRPRSPFLEQGAVVVAGEGPGCRGQRPFRRAKIGSSAAREKKPRTTMKMEGLVLSGPPTSGPGGLCAEEEHLAGTVRPAIDSKCRGRPPRRYIKGGAKVWAGPRLGRPGRHFAYGANHFFASAAAILARLGPRHSGFPPATNGPRRTWVSGQWTSKQKHFRGRQLGPGPIAGAFPNWGTKKTSRRNSIAPALQRGGPSARFSKKAGGKGRREGKKFSGGGARHVGLNFQGQKTSGNFPAGWEPHLFQRGRLPSGSEARTLWKVFPQRGPGWGPEVPGPATGPQPQIALDFFFLRLFWVWEKGFSLPRAPGDLA